MDYSFTRGQRRRVIDDAAAYEGMGVELPDGRVLYTYLTVNSDDDQIELRRGYAPTVLTMARQDDAVDVTTTSLLGYCTSSDTANTVFQSICYIEGRLLMLVIYRGNSDVTPATFTGTALFPTIGVGLTCLESLDDGLTWSALSTPSNTGLGAAAPISGGAQSFSAITSFDGLWWASGWYTTGFFGNAIGQSCMYWSDDAGVTWNIDTSTQITLSVFSEGGWSRNLPVIDGTLYGTGSDVGGGLDIPSPLMRLTTGAGPGAWDVYDSLDDDLYQVYAHSLAYMESTASWWVYYASSFIYTTTPEYLDVIDSYEKINPRSPDSLDGGISIILVSTSGGGLLAFGDHYVDILILPGGLCQLPPLRIPWPRWAQDSGLTPTDREYQTYLDIERWWTRNRFGGAEKMFIHGERWANDLDDTVIPPRAAAMEAANYQALSRWMTRWNDGAHITPLRIPFPQWAYELDIPRQWAERECENYKAIERAASGGSCGGLGAG